jgi:hypothetical protein
MDGLRWGGLSSMDDKVLVTISRSSVAPLARATAATSPIASASKPLLSQVITQGAIIRLFVEKGIFTKGEFLEWQIC